MLKPPVADAVKTAEADQVTLVVSTADAVIVTALPAGKPWPANVTAVSHGACAGTERVGDPVADVPTADAAVPLWVPPPAVPVPERVLVLVLVHAERIRAIAPTARSR